MLDFMKEGVGNDPAAQQNDINVLASQNDDGQGFVVPAAQEKNVRQGTMILVVLFVLGGGALWLMVQKSVPKSASAAVMASETDQIETAIAKVTGTKAEFFKSVDSVMSRFSEFSKARQVRVTELQKNPFEHEKYARLSSNEYRPFASDTTSPESMGTDDLSDQARGMQLQSIMESPNGNCCMIDYKVLYAGQTINGWKVTSITDSTVELSMKDAKVTLRISSEGQ